MIIVTGGAGFIGSRLVKALEARGEQVIIVDDLTNGYQFKNIAVCDPYDYIDYEDFFKYLTEGKSCGSGSQAFSQVSAIFHQGACTDTMQWDGRYMMENNYEYSRQILLFCQKHHIPLVYASSAAVYGQSNTFSEERQNEQPVNVYGYSKWLFDHYVRQHAAAITTPVVGLRYFNVYGPGEAHKGDMASVVYKFGQQIEKNGYVELFTGSDGYADGEQRRDFIYVDDIVRVNLWFLDQPQHSGIFNLGTGRAQSFNEVAQAVIDWYGRGEVRYIPFPQNLDGHYQSFTQANIDKLRQVGYEGIFTTVEEGVQAYLDEIFL